MVSIKWIERESHCCDPREEYLSLMLSLEAHSTTGEKQSYQSFIFDLTIKIFNILLLWTKLNLLNILCIQGRSNNYNCIYLFICNLKSVILKIFIIMSKLLVSSDFCVFNNNNNSFFLHYQNLFQRNPQRNCCVSPNESRFWMNHLNWWFINSLIKALEWCGVNGSTTPKTCYLFHSLMNL